MDDDEGTADRADRRIKAYEGRAAAPTATGLDPVNAPMIRHWCEALGDGNPAYSGPDAVAPATMLQAWTMSGLAGRPGRSGAYVELLGLLDGLGCTSIVATDCEQEYLRPLRLGDEVAFDAVIESVSDRKTTKLGSGYFVTTRMDVRAGGELVGTHRFRVLKYAPRAAGAGPGPSSSGQGKPAARRPRPVVNRDNAGFWAGIRDHRLLIQRCTACGTLRHPWLPGCNSCGGLGWDTVEAGGDGTVYSYVVMHHPPFPAFEPPYAVALIELAEGVRIISNVVGVPYDKVWIGMPVRVGFRAYEEDLVLPVFHPADQADQADHADRADRADRADGSDEAAHAGRAAGPEKATRPYATAGETLAPLEIPITRTLIVAGAIASRDYQDVHHDPDLARSKGSPDVFMNILTTNGLVGRYITDRFGPTAVLRKVAIRLGAPNYPGDTMVLTGTVEDVTEEDGGGHVTATVGVTGDNRIGRHVTGTVTVTVPRQGTAPEEEA